MSERCSAPVLDTRRWRDGHLQHGVAAEKIALRASRDPDPRCQRNAKVFLRGPFGRRGFCRPHGKIWKRHYAIVERILSL